MFYEYHPEFERFPTYKSNWKTTTFTKVCGGWDIASTLTEKTAAGCRASTVRARTSIKSFPRRERSKLS